MKKSTIITIFVILFSLSFSFAKNSIWKIQGEKNTVYLVGSVHLLKNDSYPLDEAFDTAFSDAQNIVFEMNFDSAATMEMQQLALQKAMFSGEGNLKTNIPESTFKLVDSLSTSVGLDINRLLVFKPWMVATTIMMVKLQKMGFDPNLGLDRYFFAKAKENNKTILDFETFRQQLGFIDNLPMNIQNKMIIQMALEFKTIEKEFNGIVDAWKTGNSEHLEKYLLESFKSEPELYDILLTQRNLSWLQQIRKFLNDDQSYMIVVGAAHMIGENGLVELLKKENYTIEQL